MNASAQSKSKSNLFLAIIHLRVVDALLCGGQPPHVEQFDPHFPGQASPLTHLLRARQLINTQIRLQQRAQ